MPGSFLTGLLEPAVVPRPTAQHDGHPLRPEASSVRTIPHRVLQQLAVVRPAPELAHLILNDTPATFRPIVQVIDNFARNDKLGNLFEARVGGGRLLVCTINLPAIAADQPAAKQLLRSLYSYVDSASFAPATELTTTLLNRLFSSAGP